MAIAIHQYDLCRRLHAKGETGLDFGASLKMLLATSAYTFDKTHTSYNDVAGELLNINNPGYNAGGAFAASVESWDAAAGRSIFTLSDIVWAGATAWIDTVKWAILYNAEATSLGTNPLLYAIDFEEGGAGWVPDGTALTLDFGAKFLEQ